MANYCHLHLNDPLAPEELEKALQEAVAAYLGSRWVINLTAFDDDGPVWVVSIPGSGFEDAHEATKRALAPGDDFGFPVALQDQGATIAFRHGTNMFTYWAQGSIEEELSERFQVQLISDTGHTCPPPGSREFRHGRTFRDYLMRNFEMSLTDQQLAWFDRYKEVTPEGFW